MQVLPVGWTGRHYDTAFDWFAAISGIFVTAISALFGGPYWFDLLNAGRKRRESVTHR